MSSYCCLILKSSPSLIHHFNKNFPTCKRAKPELCRLSSDNAEVFIDAQQVLPISHLSFIDNGAVDIGYDHTITTNHYESMDYSATQVITRNCTCTDLGMIGQRLN
jgi:Ca2+-dependent lipid-binding protein